MKPPREVFGMFLLALALLLAGANASFAATIATTNNQAIRYQFQLIASAQARVPVTRKSTCTRPC